MELHKNYCFVDAGPSAGFFRICARYLDKPVMDLIKQQATRSQAQLRSFRVS